MDELPHNVNELVSVNYIALSDTIKFLYDHLKKLSKSVEDIEKEMTTFNIFKNEITDFKIQKDLQNKKFEEIQTSFNNYSNKFLSIDENMNNTNTKLNELDELVKSKFKEDEENNNFLTQIKNDMEKINSKFEEQNNVFNCNIDSIKNINENLADNSKKIVLLNESLSNLHSKIDDTKSNLILNFETEKNNNNQKFNDITNLLNTHKDILAKLKNDNTQSKVNIDKNKNDISVISNKLSIKNSNIIKTEEEEEKVNEDNNNNNIAVINANLFTESSVKSLTRSPIKNKADIFELNSKLENIIQKEQNDYDNLYNLYKTIKEGITSTNNNNNINESKETINNNKSIDINSSQNIIEKAETKTKVNLNQSNISQKKRGNISSSLGIEKLDTNAPNFNEKVLEYITKLNSFLNEKASQDELNKVEQNTKKMILDISNQNETNINDLNDKITSIKSLLELKSGSNGENNIANILNVISQSMKDFLYSKEGSKIIKNSISGANMFDNQTFTDSINDLTNKLSELNSKVSELNQNLENNIQENISENTNKIEDMDTSLKKLKLNLQMLTQSILGDKPYINNVGQPLKEVITDLEIKTNKIQGETIKLDKKTDNLINEVSVIIQRDLKAEGQKILEEFKDDLKRSLAVIESQLKNKVDNFGLLQFGQKIDSKMSNEIKRKVGKDDLNRNNIYINKKIDLLENRISKSLVDTLIDLQMEEAPLLVKKNIKMGSYRNNTCQERCASCNQVIPDTMFPLLKYNYGNNKVSCYNNLQTHSQNYNLTDKNSVSILSGKSKKNAITINDSSINKSNDIIYESDKNKLPDII